MRTFDKQDKDLMPCIMIYHLLYNNRAILKTFSRKNTWNRLITTKKQFLVMSNKNMILEIILASIFCTWKIEYGLKRQL